MPTRLKIDQLLVVRYRASPQLYWSQRESTWVPLAAATLYLEQERDFAPPPADGTWAYLAVEIDRIERQGRKHP